MSSTRWLSIAAAVVVVGLLILRKQFRRKTGPLPNKIATFVRQALQGVENVLDVHMHCVGMQHSLTGCCLHHRAWSTPLHYAKTRFFCFALGVSDFTCSDAQMVKQLLAHLNYCTPYVKMRGMLLAFDATYDEQGNQSMDRTSFLVPNEHVLDVCKQSNGLLLPCCSIHPYRKDALEMLRHYHVTGIRMVKWLPNSQFIDPSNPICAPFYTEMARLGMVLLCHVGDEHSVTTAGVTQSLGDPRRLVPALDAGVKVIMAHCASEGVATDGMYNFDVFLSMMRQPKYVGLLFGDVSATPAFLRSKFLKRLAACDQEFKGRLFYGSDYPVPCIPLVPLTIVHWALGLITWEQRALLNELYEYNVLLFNLVLLRLVIDGNTSVLQYAPNIALHASLQ